MTIPVQGRQDPLRVALHVFVYVVLYFVTATIFGQPLRWLGGDLVGIIGTGLLSAVFANWLALRIYENRHIVELGLWWNRCSLENLGLGVLGGAGSAALVLLPPVALRLAHFVATPEE